MKRVDAADGPFSGAWPGRCGCGRKIVKIMSFDPSFTLGSSMMLTWAGHLQPGEPTHVCISAYPAGQRVPIKQRRGDRGHAAIGRDHRFGSLAHQAHRRAAARNAMIAS